jgi:hypothetical protein
VTSILRSGAGQHRKPREDPPDCFWTSWRAAKIVVQGAREQTFCLILPIRMLKITNDLQRPGLLACFMPFRPGAHGTRRDSVPASTATMGHRGRYSDINGPSSPSLPGSRRANPTIKDR